MFDDWKTLSVNPAVNGYLFQIIGKDKAVKGEPFFSCAQCYSGSLTLTAPMAIRLWETITFYMFNAKHNVL